LFESPFTACAGGELFVEGVTAVDAGHDDALGSVVDTTPVVEGGGVADNGSTPGVSPFIINFSFRRFASLVTGLLT